eukprot:gene10266-31358_t
MGKSNNSKSKVNKARIAAHQGRRGGANAKLSRKQRKKKMSEDEWFERREQLVMPNVAAAVGINLLGTCAGGGGGGAAASYTAAALGEVADPDVPGGSDGEDGVEGEQQPTQHSACGGGGDGSGGNNHAGKKRKKKRHTRQKTERLLAGTAGRQKRRQGLPGLFALSILSVLSNTIACVGSVTAAAAWDCAGNNIVYTATSTFETGPMESSDWHGAGWITGGPGIQYRQQFSVNGKVPQPDLRGICPWASERRDAGIDLGQTGIRYMTHDVGSL